MARQKKCNKKNSVTEFSNYILRRKVSSSKCNKSKCGLVLMIVGIIIIASGITLAVLKNNGAGVTVHKIAVIPVYGEISLLGSGASSKELVTLINKAEKDSSIKAIILDIDSPGGTVVASKEIAFAVYNSNKPVVALVREIATSGAYLVASASDKIVADEASMTGSIGVIASYLQFSDAMDKYGITYEQIISGKYKDMGTPYKELTREEKKLLVKKVDIINNMFIDLVTEYRCMKREHVAELATGEVFLGVEAMNNGLIDIYGNKLKAQHVAEELAGISASELVEYSTAFTWYDLFSQRAEMLAHSIGTGMGEAITGIKTQVGVVFR